jgi:hypothetical protein
MKYAIFFGSIFSLLLWRVWSRESALSLLWIYPLISAVILTIAYATNTPKLIVGKTTTGDINSLLVTINFPWLLITWVIWEIQAKLSSEDLINQIAGTNIYIGCYPKYSEIDQFDLVIDLTAEFCSHKGQAKTYLGVPNLDGMPLRNVVFPTGMTLGSKIFIHCAQGHGRTATYTSLLLAHLGIARSQIEALSLILNSRPAAQPAKLQIRQISTNHDLGRL